MSENAPRNKTPWEIRFEARREAKRQEEAKKVEWKAHHTIADRAARSGFARLKNGLLLEALAKFSEAWPEEEKAAESYKSTHPDDLKTYIGLTAAAASMALNARDWENADRISTVAVEKTNPVDFEYYHNQSLRIQKQARSHLPGKISQSA